MLKHIDILSLFPNMFEEFLKTSIIGKAIENKNINVNIRNFRDFSTDKNKKVDDYPYGGGAGLLLKIQPIYDCLNYCINQSYSSKYLEIIMMTPKGEKFNQKIAEELVMKNHLIFLCGHYEGFDDRIREHLITREISVGDFICTGGEIPSMLILDSIIRLLNNVINKESLLEESLVNELLEYPQYTRPYEFNGWKVPDVLVTGNHKNINDWRLCKSKEITKKRRPDLYLKYLKKNEIKNE